MLSLLSFVVLLWDLEVRFNQLDTAQFVGLDGRDDRGLIAQVLESVVVDFSFQDDVFFLALLQFFIQHVDLSF